MRALVMTEPAAGSDRTLVREVAEPAPGPGAVTIDVSWAGINFVDVMARRGDTGYVSAWPFVPGKEVAGTIRATGANVTGLVPGQRVAAFLPAGGLAEVALAAAELTVPVPDPVGLREAAAVPALLATAMLLLTDAARIGAGDSVLVHSASGGVGSAVAQLIPVLGGGRLIGTVGTAAKIDWALASGYDLAFARDGGLADAVRAAAGGGGVDVILDPLGTSMLQADLDLIAPGGRIVFFGNATGGEQAPLPPLPRLLRGNITIAGFSVTGLAAAAPHRVAAAMRRSLDLVAAGTVRLPVTEIGSLAEVPAAHQLLADGSGRGKYVARVGGFSYLLGVPSQRGAACQPASRPAAGPLAPDATAPRSARNRAATPPCRAARLARSARPPRRRPHPSARPGSRTTAPASARSARAGSPRA